MFRLENPVDIAKNLSLSHIDLHKNIYLGQESRVLAERVEIFSDFFAHLTYGFI